MSGEPQIKIPKDLYLEVCCDCGLVHAVFYRIITVNRKWAIEKTVYRDDWETKGERKIRK